MSNQLNLFPSRAAIGKTAEGSPVYMTPEFTRALADLLVRVGGPNGLSADDLQADAAIGATGMGAALLQTVLELQIEVATLSGRLAALGALRGQLDALEHDQVGVAALPDWERPGKIGAAAPNSGEFTTVNGVKVTKPTNPATPATLTLADDKTFKVNNTLTLSGDDGAALAIGAGGTLKSAAYKETTDFAARSTTALAAPATDAASTQALANSLRAVLLSVGIGT